MELSEKLRDIIYPNRKRYDGNWSGEKHHRYGYEIGTKTRPSSE